MNVRELFYELQLAMASGFSESKVLFDTEARNYDCHLVEITDVYTEDGGDGEPCLVLYDHKTPHITEK